MMEELQVKLKKIKKLFKWYLIIMVVYVLIMAVISQYVWDHVVIDILAILPMVGLLIIFFKRDDLEHKIYLLKPHSDFPLVQRDVKIYKKTIKIINVMVWLHIGVLIFIWVDFMLNKYGLKFLNINISNELFLGVLAWASFLILLLRDRVVMEHKQYEKYYKQYDTKDIIKEDSKDEQLDQ